MILHSLNLFRDSQRFAAAITLSGRVFFFNIFFIRALTYFFVCLCSIFGSQAGGQIVLAGTKNILHLLPGFPKLTAIPAD